MPLTLGEQPLALVVKNETAVRHRRAENQLLPLLQSLRSAADYAALLKRFYGFYEPLETLVRHYITPALLPDVEERGLARRLFADLTVLGESGHLPCCSALPRVQSAAEAFGAMYVMEGSTLGGRVLLKMFAQRGDLNLPPEAFHFFSGYGAETGRRWTSFIHALNGQQNTQAVVGAANETFAHLENWMNDGR